MKISIALCNAYNIINMEIHYVSAVSTIDVKTVNWNLYGIAFMQ